MRESGGRAMALVRDVMDSFVIVIVTVIVIVIVIVIVMGSPVMDSLVLVLVHVAYHDVTVC